MQGVECITDALELLEQYHAQTTETRVSEGRVQSIHRIYSKFSLPFRHLLQSVFSRTLHLETTITLAIDCKHPLDFAEVAGACDFLPIPITLPT